MTLADFMKLSWKQYLVLEADFGQTERYISFEQENFSAYSQEYIKQLQAICGEIDVQCKQYCKFLDTSFNGIDISSYASVLLRRKANIKNAVVLCKELQLKPWEMWSSDVEGDNKKNHSPRWWKDYNKVKHERLGTDSFGKYWYTHANLENTMNALAALYVLCMNFYKDLAVKERNRMTVQYQESTIFTYKDWESSIITISRKVFVSQSAI